MTVTIPFLNFFRKAKDQVVPKTEGPAATPQPVAPLEKPSSERFSKTVMPNATHTVSRRDPLDSGARSSAMNDQVSFGSGVAPETSGPRTISFGGSTPAARSLDLPPAIALALEPVVERVISLQLGDIAPEIPADYIKPIECIDGTRRVLLKASEIEKGMASMKPTVSLAAIYEQVPEIFLRKSPPSDGMQVQLPFKKVLEQFTSLQVRRDQERHQAVPQVETPFLQVTLEDNSRFGTTTEAVEVGDYLPPVRIELATAEAYAAAEPEATANGFVPTLANPPTRIPFTPSPNGTGGLATESVPASSGPSVPTSVPTASTPGRTPGKTSASLDDKGPPKQEPWLTAEGLASFPKAGAIAVTASRSPTKITLPLKPILQGIPPFQLSGDPGNVSAEAQIEVPFSLIEPQLAIGRIALAPAVFQEALPAEYRGLFKAVEGTADIILPLQDVLKNLPTASLRLREDQEEQEAGPDFATPFSAKAEEDAKRFETAARADAKPILTPVTAGETVPVAPSAVNDLFGPPPRTPLQVALETDEKLDAKGVVALINKIAGVKACALVFGDGLSLAGSLPAEYATDGLCAMAPSLMQRIGNHVVETKLGPLRGMTLSCAKGAVTFFMHENLCLAALHGSGDLSLEVREKLTRIVHELALKYSHSV